MQGTYHLGDRLHRVSHKPLPLLLPLLFLPLPLIRLLMPLLLLLPLLLLAPSGRCPGVNIRSDGRGTTRRPDGVGRQYRRRNAKAAGASAGGGGTVTLRKIGRCQGMCAFCMWRLLFCEARKDLGAVDGCSCVRLEKGLIL